MGESKSNEAKETKQDQRRGLLFCWRPGAPYTYSPCLQPPSPAQEARKRCIKVNPACGPGCYTASQGWVFCSFYLFTSSTFRCLASVPRSTMMVYCYSTA